MYGIKPKSQGSAERLCIAGANGIVELTKSQAVALFYELGDILVHNMGVTV